MKNRLLYVALTASVFLASWGALFKRLLSWADGS